MSKETCARYYSQLERDCRDIAGMLQTVRLIRSAPDAVRDVISGYGEIWSTRLFYRYMQQRAKRRGLYWVDARACVQHGRGHFERPRRRLRARGRSPSSRSCDSR